MALKYFNPQFKELTKTPARKTYTVLVVTIALVAIMIFLAIRPAIVSIFDRLHENEQKQELLEDMDKKYQALIKLNRQEEQYQSTLQLLDVSLPEKRQEEFVEANLVAMLNDSGLTLMGVNLNKAPKKLFMDEKITDGKISGSYLYLNVEGSRNSILKFIEKIESFPRLLNIVKYSYVPDNGKKDGDFVKANFEIEFYYYL